MKTVMKYFLKILSFNLIWCKLFLTPINPQENTTMIRMIKVPQKCNRKFKNFPIFPPHKIGSNSKTFKETCFFNQDENKKCAHHEKENSTYKYAKNIIELLFYSSHVYVLAHFVWDTPIWFWLKRLKRKYPDFRLIPGSARCPFMESKIWTCTPVLIKKNN